VSLALAMILALPAAGYDYPLTSGAIREAYFLGTRQAGEGTAFLPEYTHFIPTLTVGEGLVSRVHIETPFFQVAEHAGKSLNYTAQDAVKDFYDKPAVFRMVLEICYKVDAPLPSAVKIVVLQNNKEILPNSDERAAFFPATDPYTRTPNVGEIVRLEFDPQKFDSSTLTIQVVTPDGQHDATKFDLSKLR
jgi:hypothetical protein